MTLSREKEPWKFKWIRGQLTSDLSYDENGEWQMTRGSATWNPRVYEAFYIPKWRLKRMIEDVDEKMKKE